MKFHAQFTTLNALQQKVAFSSQNFDISNMIVNSHITTKHPYYVTRLQKSHLFNLNETMCN